MLLFSMPHCSSGSLSPSINVPRAAESVLSSVCRLIRAFPVLGKVFRGDSYPLWQIVPFVQCCSSSYLTPKDKIYPLIWTEYLDIVSDGRFVKGANFAFVVQLCNFTSWAFGARTRIRVRPLKWHTAHSYSGEQNPWVKGSVWFVLEFALPPFSPPLPSVV